jgi:hypothetical protein
MELSARNSSSCARACERLCGYIHREVGKRLTARTVRRDRLVIATLNCSMIARRVVDRSHSREVAEECGVAGRKEAVVVCSTLRCFAAWWTIGNCFRARLRLCTVYLIVEQRLFLRVIPIYPDSSQSIPFLITDCSRLWHGRSRGRLESGRDMYGCVVVGSM